MFKNEKWYRITNFLTRWSRFKLQDSVTQENVCNRNKRSTVTGMDQSVQNNKLKYIEHEEASEVKATILGHMNNNMEITSAIRNKVDK